MNTSKHLLLKQPFESDCDLLHPIKGCIHDIRNMLAVIEGNAFLVNDNDLSEDVRASIKSMEHAAQYAEVLCSQIMQCLTSGDSECEPINLSAMIEEIGVLLMSVVSKKDFIDFNLEVNLPEINGIAAQLKRVVINLVLNASQAIGNKRGVIRISTSLSSDAQRIELTVSDNGCGMDTAMLAKIFDASFTTKAKGTGIGLNSVQSIVQKHGGTMNVDSLLNQGAVFTASLPIV